MQDDESRDTCVNVMAPGSDYFECSVCHGRMLITDPEYDEPTTWTAEGTGTLPAFCPSCGRAIDWQ